MKQIALLGILLTLLTVDGVRAAEILSLDEAVDTISAHILQDHPLSAPRNNIAVMKFSSVTGGETDLGDFLLRKIRIRMFELDKKRTLNFVSQGKITSLLMKEGLQSLSEVFDESKRVELGKLLTASHFIHGTYEIFQGSTVEIVGYLVDIKTGVILSQKVVSAKGVPGYLLAMTGGSQTNPSKYKLFTGRHSSHPEAAKMYKMAGILEKRGRKNKASQKRGQILIKYPNSLEALYIQIQNMTDDTVRLTQAKQFDQGLYVAIQAVPAPYRKLPAYQRLMTEEIKWLDNLVVHRTEQKTFSQSLYDSLKGIPLQNLGTAGYKDLRTHTGAWMVVLGDRAISEQGDFRIGKSYYRKAEHFSLGEDEKKWLADYIRAAEIRFAVRHGNKEQAEMALVEWETEAPDSPIVLQLWKELDRPPGMVNIPRGQVNGIPIGSFNLDIYETTNPEFLEFVKANPSYRKSKMDGTRNDMDYLKRWDSDLSYSGGYANLPVVFVSQIVASSYCKWKGKRLPTSLEWGLAAGQGRKKYPWGNKEPTKDIANFKKSLTGNPMPGDSHPQGATSEGVFHMGGNVWELTSTVLKGNVVARGGSYFDRAEALTNDYSGIHSTDPPSYSSRFTGFRCAH